jgi:hypothetical protein
VEKGEHDGRHSDAVKNSETDGCNTLTARLRSWFAVGSWTWTPDFVLKQCGTVKGRNWRVSARFLLIDFLFLPPHQRRWPPSHNSPQS